MAALDPLFVLSVAAASGVIGWGIENAIFGPRHSKLFDREVPFLPVYAAGGAAVALLSPLLEDDGALVRGAIFGTVLTGLEAVAGLAERAQGRRSWDYGGSPVDLPHAIAWAGLGLGLDAVLRRTR